MIQIYASFKQELPGWYRLVGSISPDDPRWPEDKRWPLTRQQEARLLVEAVERLPVERLRDQGVSLYSAAASMDATGWRTVLLAAVHPRRPETRRWALSAVLDSGFPDPECAELVVSLLRHEDPQIQLLATCLVVRMLHVNPDLAVLRDPIVARATASLNAEAGPAVGPVAPPTMEVMRRRNGIAASEIDTIDWLCVNTACWLGDPRVAAVVGTHINQWIAQSIASIRGRQPSHMSNRVLGVAAQLSPDVAAMVIDAFAPHINDRASTIQIGCCFPPTGGENSVARFLQGYGQPSMRVAEAVVLEAMRALPAADAAVRGEKLPRTDWRQFAISSIGALPQNAARREFVRREFPAHDPDNLQHRLFEVDPDLHVQTMADGGPAGWRAAGYFQRSRAPLLRRTAKAYADAVLATPLPEDIVMSISERLVRRCNMSIADVVGLIPEGALATRSQSDTFLQLIASMSPAEAQEHHAVLLHLCRHGSFDLVVAATERLSAVSPRHHSDVHRAFDRLLSEGKDGGQEQLLLHHAARLGVDTPALRRLAGRAARSHDGSAGYAVRFCGFELCEVSAPVRPCAIIASRINLSAEDLCVVFPDGIDGANASLIDKASDSTRRAMLEFAAGCDDWPGEVEARVVAATRSDEPSIRMAAYGALATRDPETSVSAWLCYGMMFDPDPRIRAMGPARAALLRSPHQHPRAPLHR